MIRHIALVVALGAVVAGCTGPSHAGRAPTSPPVAGATPTRSPVVAPPPPPAGGKCEAASLMYLIGKPHTDIPVPVEPAGRRVYCSSCIITEDYVPGRTDIVFDSRTGIVTQVKCG